MIYYVLPDHTLGDISKMYLLWISALQCIKKCKFSSQYGSILRQQIYPRSSNQCWEIIFWMDHNPVAHLSQKCNGSYNWQKMINKWAIKQKISRLSNWSWNGPPKESMKPTIWDKQKKKKWLFYHFVRKLIWNFLFIECLVFEAL